MALEYSIFNNSCCTVFGHWQKSPTYTYKTSYNFSMCASFCSLRNAHISNSGSKLDFFIAEMNGHFGWVGLCEFPPLLETMQYILWNMFGRLHLTVTAHITGRHGPQRTAERIFSRRITLFHWFWVFMFLFPKCNPISKTVGTLWKM